MGIDRDLTRGALVERVTRIHATLAKAAGAILRIRQRLPLFEEVCRVLVEEGQLRMAWVGEIDDHGWIVPVAHAGAAQRYLDDIRVSVLDVAEGRGPTGIAARERHRVFTTDVATDARMALWRDEAHASGFRSSAAFPLVVEDRCVAVLTAYASEPGFFDEQEVAMFDRVAADLSFALETMEREERRRELEAQLRASEERYRRALSVLSDGIVVQGSDGAIISCNPAAERILGLSVDQMKGVRSTDPRWRAVHEDGSPFPGEEHPAMVTLRTGTPQENVIMGVHKRDGSLSWISINSIAFPDVGDSGAGAVVTSFADITARRDAEARLREDEERLNATIGSMRDAVAILSPVRDETDEIIDFRYDYANEAHCELVGRDREQLLTRRVDEVHPGWARSDRFELYRQVMLTGEPCRSEDFHPEQDWGTAFARREIDNFVSRAGEQVVVSGRDVTDRRRAEAQLRASEERFDAAVGSMLDAFTILSPVRDERGGIVDFRWEYVNDAYCELVGFDRDQLVGRRLVELLPGLPASERFALCRRVLETGEPCLSVDVAAPEAWVGGRVASQVLDTMIVAAGENIVVTARDVTERHRLEHQLRASEERFRGGFEHSPIGMTLTNLDGTWERVNAAFARMLGYEDPQELAGVNFASLTHPDDVDVFDGFRATLEQDRSYTAQKRYLRRDGEVVTVILVATALSDEQGHPVELFTQAQDITERERAERGREQALAELEEAQHIAQLGSWRWDPSAGTQVWSAGMYLVYGCDPVVGPMDPTQSFAFVHPDDLERVQGAYARMRETGAGFELDYRLVTADGVTRPVHAIARPDPDEPGCYRGTLQDITERTRDELALRRAGEQLELAQQIAELGSFSTNPASGETVWSAELFRIFGRDPADGPPHATELLSYLDPEDAELVRAAYERVPADDTRAELDFRVRAGDGAKRIVHMIVRRDPDRAGFCSGTVQDVTRLRAVERALREQSEQAEAATRAKSEFLARMSHELRTPLNAIIGFGQLLALDELTDQQRESVHYVLSGGRHLLGLIDEVLELARIESGRMTISPEPVALADTVREVLALVAPLARDRGIVLASNTDGLAHDGHVHADRHRLKQVLLNLLSNSIKYNNPGGRVNVSFQITARGRVRTTIADTGIGIPPHLLVKLFEPFERLGAEFTNVEGTGLGLALSKGLIEAMGGTIEVASKPGTGTAFTVELARAERPGDEHEPGPHDQELADLGGRGDKRQVILYIEDNLSNLTLVERILQRYPTVELLPAMQATLGLELARQHHPDLIVLDLHLPDMPGAEVLKRLKAEHTTREIPVVVLTADASKGQSERVTQLGAAAYLTKPLDVPGFIEVIARNLDATTRRKLDR